MQLMATLVAVIGITNLEPSLRLFSEGATLSIAVEAASSPQRGR